VNLAAYRTILRLPRVRSMILLMLLARVPPTAAGMTLTLHVVLALDRGYGAAGFVGSASTVGIALGAPLMGRLTDRRGLRVMLLVAMTGESLFWFTAPLLSFHVLLVTAFVSGVLSLPVMSISRQVVLALVPPEQRRTALALDSMAVEAAFVAGPALAVLLTARASSTAAILAVGAAMLLSGLVLYAADPPVRSEEELAVVAEPVPRRSWLTGELLAVLVAAGAATFVLTGVEVSLVASLQQAGRTQWTGAVIAVMGVSSLVGGFVYGAVRVPPPRWLLLTLLGALAVPVGLAGGTPWLLALALVPTNLVCAPTIAATGEAISLLAPVAARGEAMGLQGSAFTLGSALGAPSAGVVIDRFGPAWGFAAVGLGGLLLAGVAALLPRLITPAPVGARTSARGN
jgi:predicted MFS family arabinose efflux permease